MNEYSFCIQNKRGFYFEPSEEPIITVDALKLIENKLKNNELSKYNKDIILNFIDAVKKCPVIRRWGYWKENDGNTTKPNNSYGVHLMSYCVISKPLGGGRSTYIKHEVGNKQYSSDINSWGLNFEPVIPSLKTIKKIAEELGIKIDTMAIKNSNKFKEKLNNGEYSVVFPSIENHLYKTKAWAIYLPKEKLFADKYSEPVPLSSARMFSSIAAAEQSIKRTIALCNTGAEIIEVDMKISAIVTQNSNQASEIQEALAMSKKDMIEEALKEADLERLRARVEELEPERKVTTKKKMM